MMAFRAAGGSGDSRVAAAYGLPAPSSKAPHPSARNPSIGEARGAFLPGKARQYLSFTAACSEGAACRIVPTHFPDAAMNAPCPPNCSPTPAARMEHTLRPAAIR